MRLRHYVCSHCGTTVGNREVAMKKLEEGKRDILCVNCEKRILLWDEMEDLFASDATKQRVRELREQSALVLDNESKERALVGEVISTVALAGQICREFNVSDHGIDMEIEFKNDAGEAIGRKVYLQLKSGDSYLRQRKGGGAHDQEGASRQLLDSAGVSSVPGDSDVRRGVRWMESAGVVEARWETGEEDRL